MHTRNDKEVDWEKIKKIKESQREPKGQVSKCFRIGSYRKQGCRIRETMMYE